MAITPQWNRENRLVLIEELKKHPLLWEEDEFGGLQRLEAIEQVRKAVNKTQGDRLFTHRNIGEKLSDLISAYRDLANKMNRDREAGLGVKEPEWEFFPNLKFLGGLDTEVENELRAQALSQAANQPFYSQVVGNEFCLETKNHKEGSQTVSQQDSFRILSQEIHSQTISQGGNSQDSSQPHQFPSTLAFFENIEQPSSKLDGIKNKKKEAAKGKKKAVLDAQEVEWSTEESIRLLKEYQKYPKLWKPNPKDYLRTFGNYHIKARYKALSLLAASFNKFRKNPCHQQQIKAHLNALRMQYRKEMKEWENTGIVPTWPLFHHMKFLGNSSGGPLSIPDPKKVAENVESSQNKDDEEGNTSIDASKWTFKRNLRLVKEYQRHPRLWSPTYTVYSVKHSCGGGVIKRSQEIELITEAMNKFEKIPFTYHQIQQQIRYLRMKYGAYFKTYLTHCTEPNWKLFKHMRFLDDTVGVADPKEVVVKQEHLKDQDRHNGTICLSRETSPIPVSKRRSSASMHQNSSTEENKENIGPRKQPKISSYLLLPAQGQRTKRKQTFSVSSSDSNPDDIIFTQAPENPPSTTNQPSGKKGKLVSLVEDEPSKDISVLNVSTESEIWIEEQEKKEQLKENDGDLNTSYCFRASTKRASLASIQTTLNKTGTPNSHYSTKINEKSGKADNRWSRIRELVAATPNNTPEQMMQDLYMVESFLSTNCTVESPDIVYEKSLRRHSTNTTINSSSVSENLEDANVRFVEFVADALKRIALIKPYLIAGLRKTINDALFDAEFEEEK